MKCANCGHKADETDIKLASLTMSPLGHWFCSKGCWEAHTLEYGEIPEEGEHYGVIYSVVKNREVGA